MTNKDIKTLTYIETKAIKEIKAAYIETIIEKVPMHMIDDITFKLPSTENIINDIEAKVNTHKSSIINYLITKYVLTTYGDRQ